jgi:putative toxin-antitoxin system antitoxin component (TIGR02293 family)
MPRRRMQPLRRTRGSDKRLAVSVSRSKAARRKPVNLDQIQRVPGIQAMPDIVEDLTGFGYSKQEIFALVIPKRTLMRRKSASLPLTIEETDKALRLERVASHARRVFKDADKADRWLRKPKRGLSGETPLAFLASESGARVVEAMLYRIEHGIFA